MAIAGPLVNAQAFVAEFGKEWEAMVNRLGCEFPPEWDDPNPAAWTRHMISESGFIDRVKERLDPSLKYVREVFKIDGLFYTGAHPFGKNTSWEPSRLHVFIEHENWTDIQEEMRRLMCLHCPLKVLIFYDYTEGAKEAKPSRRNWVQEKLHRIYDMITDANAYFPENPETAYVFLVATRVNIGRDDYVRWRAVSCQVTDPKPLKDPAQLRYVYDGMKENDKPL